MNRSRIFHVVLALLLAAFTPVARAQFGTHASATLVASESPLPAGRESRLAVTLDIEPGWHAQSALPYTKNFIPTVLTLKAPQGIALGQFRYPVGEDDPSDPRLGFGDNVSVYRNSLVILVPITIAPNALAGKLTITGKLHLQYCDDKSGNCLPDIDLPLSLAVTIAPAGTSTQPKNQDVFADAANLKFYTAENFIEKTSVRSLPTTSTTPAAIDNSPGVDVTLHTEVEQLAYIETHDFAPANEKVYPIWMLAIFAILGGAILNIMPCVLPVIPLKVLSLVQQANGDRKHSLYHALVFGAGIITLFLVLGGLLRGFDFFYGQQFQSTLFLVSLAYLVLALALSMIGVWTINTPTAVYKLEKPRTGYAGSFMSGLLATLLATPCSAPLLGSFLAWALVQPAWITVLSLGLVGVGMAAPYVILAAYPAALSKIPTAGRWAELIKQGLGIVMVGVAVFLLTRIANVGYWPAAFFGAVLLGAACWGWGQIPNPTAEPRRIWTIRLIIVALAIPIAALICFTTLPKPQPVSDAPKIIHLPNKSDGKTWLPFNTALFEEARKQKRPVIIDWTAEWCLNCKSVEVFVLDTDAVRDQFAMKNAVLLRADLTAENEPAKKLNGKLKGQSIPVLAIFPPANPFHPDILRDLYTTADLTAIINRRPE